MKRDNRGLSLVELIIVIAIIAVLGGTIVYGVGMISGKPAEVCANKLASALQNDRVTAMGKMDARLELYTKDGGIWIKEADGSKTTAVQIGDAGVELQYRITGDAEDVYRNLGDEAHPLILSFDRSTGAFHDLSEMDASLAGKYCLEIKCSKAHKIKRLMLSWLTGKISVQ